MQSEVFNSPLQDGTRGFSSKFLQRSENYQRHYCAFSSRLVSILNHLATEVRYTAIIPAFELKLDSNGFRFFKACYPF